MMLVISLAALKKSAGLFIRILLLLALLGLVLPIVLDGIAHLVAPGSGGHLIRSPSPMTQAAPAGVEVPNESTRGWLSGLIDRLVEWLARVYNGE